MDDIVLSIDDCIQRALEAESDFVAKFLGTNVFTARFCTVRINEVFSFKEDAREAGYTEPAYFTGPEPISVYGRSIGQNKMEFAAVRKEVAR